jgi:hypothetical protein
LDFCRYKSRVDHAVRVSPHTQTHTHNNMKHIHIIGWRNYFLCLFVDEMIFCPLFK